MKLAALVALLQALILWALHASVTRGSWPSTDPAWLLALYPLAVLAPLTVLLLWAHRRRALLWSMVIAWSVFMLLAGLTAFALLEAPLTEDVLDDNLVAMFYLPAFLAWGLALPILRGRLESGQWHPPYADLFRASWRSYLSLAEATLFTGIFWALLGLWAALFDTLGNDFFVELFSDPRFFYPATTLSFAAAIQFIGQGDRLVDGLLDQLLGLLKWLAPLAGVIVVAFTLAALPKLPQLLASGERVMNSAALLALVVATILLLNAAYRDGTTEPDYGRVIRQALRIVPVLLCVVAATALYSLLVRTLEMGLTPPRFWGLLVAMFALLYALGYTYAARVAAPWFADLNRVNFVLAASLIVVLFATLTPLADPQRASIAHQLARFESHLDPQRRGQALTYLRFEAGERGRVSLRRWVAEGEDRGVAPARLEEARQMLSLSSRPARIDPLATPARYTLWRSKLRILPAGHPVAPELEALLEREFQRVPSRVDPEGGKLAPVLAFIDLDGDGDEEAMLITEAREDTRDIRLFEFDPAGPQGWRRMPKRNEIAP